MCVHSPLNQTYWSDIGHGVINAMINTFVCILHHGVCQITMFDLMMNAHTCATDNSTCTMFFGRSVCLDIQHGPSNVISNTCLYIQH
jgi:hypothetical protein